MDTSELLEQLRVFQQELLQQVVWSSPSGLPETLLESYQQNTEALLADLLWSEEDLHQKVVAFLEQIDSIKSPLLRQQAQQNFVDSIKSQLQSDFKSLAYFQAGVNILEEPEI